MNIKWIISFCCSLAVLGMFLPFYQDKVLASLPLNISFTGAAMFGKSGEAAADQVVFAKLLAYLVWSIPLTAAMMVFAAAIGPVTRLARTLVGLLWIIVVAIIPSIAVNVALAATKPFFPGLPSSIGWVGLGVGGWFVALAGVAMVVSAVAGDRATTSEAPSQGELS